MQLFYARPAHVPHQNHIIVGLPPKRACVIWLLLCLAHSHLSLTPFSDILNRLNPSYHRKSKISPENFVEPDARTQEEHARHLAKYIFARQYGLSNVFDLSARSQGSMKVPDFTDRESEITVLIPLYDNTPTWALTLVVVPRPKVHVKLRNGSKRYCRFLRRWSGDTVNVDINRYATRPAPLK